MSNRVILLHASRNVASGSRLRDLLYNGASSLHMPICNRNQRWDLKSVFFPWTNLLSFRWQLNHFGYGLVSHELGNRSYRLRVESLRESHIWDDQDWMHGEVTQKGQYFDSGHQCSTFRRLHRYPQLEKMETFKDDLSARLPNTHYRIFCVRSFYPLPGC